MSTHNMFSSRNKKNIDTLWLKKAPYQELCLLIFKKQHINGKPELFRVLYLP